MTVIELDLDTPLDPDAARTPPPWRYRRLGLLLTLVLLAVLGGAATPSGWAWRYLGDLPATEARIQLAGGRLFTVERSGGRRLLHAWSLRATPERLWTTEVPIDPEVGMFGPLQVTGIGGVLLVGEGRETTVLDPGTGRVRWTAPQRMLTGSGGTGVTTEAIFRPGTLYDQDSGDPGRLYFSADAQPHTEPPLRTEVRGLDLATGERRWTFERPGSVIVEPLPDGDPAVLITSSDRLSLVDARTGELLREAALPRLDGSGPGSASLLAGVALVDYQEAGKQVGYDARTLDRLWTRDLAYTLDPADCPGLLCTGDRDETLVLDPRTGKPGWRLPAADYLSPRAGYVLWTEASSGTPLRLVDARTGEPRTDLAGWGQEVTAPPERMLVLLRGNRGGGQVFGAVLPGDPRVRTLGVADVEGRDCAADDWHIVCRDGARLRVWAYRE
ncbi:PQQ-binding-like beta-propeller repeat protein [Actinoplanes utahensis]|uniref:outer membrane protein assembly factor BamB family protein n=1 Tax=Actinoplanes utahensis TaxID=1869 RepID=UPI000A8319F1|nr:PQQ-binding-like beta-propeller repeat protein [Actinoplanes utahensis]GIF34350.1 hypothetical protein Aut01nite_73360 [Actinoplanes utahensis]